MATLTVGSLTMRVGNSHAVAFLAATSEHFVESNAGYTLAGHPVDSEESIAVLVTAGTPVECHLDGIDVMRVDPERHLVETWLTAMRIGRVLVIHGSVENSSSDASDRYF